MHRDNIKSNAVVSVVIPSLGGCQLAGTLHALNAGSLVPSEILICIPEVKRQLVECWGVTYSNVKVISCEVIGQVGQRVAGFKSAKCEFVLQLDDDVLVDYNCLERLVSWSLKGENYAVGPAFYDTEAGAFHSPNVPGRRGGRIFDLFCFFFINGVRGYQPGAIGISGVNMGFPENGDFEDVDWLPGGCVLHRKSLLCTDHYYGFKGKAYCEDLFHSFILRGRGVKLVRVGSARCSTPIGADGRSSIQFLLAEQVRYSRAMNYFCRFGGFDQFRLNLFLIINNINNIKRMLNKKIRHLLVK